MRETELSRLVQQLGFQEQLAAVDLQEGVELHLAQESSRLVDFERNLQLLESSQAVDRVAEIEVKVAIMRREADVIADRLARCQRALGDAKGIDRAVRRTQAEIVDERLAMISPLLDELYQRLRPHTDWRTIEYSIRGDVRRFLSLKVGDGLNPQFVFSSVNVVRRA